MSLRSFVRGVAALALAFGLLTSALPMHAAAVDDTPTCASTLTASTIKAELSGVGAEANLTSATAYAAPSAARPFCVTCNCEACCLPYGPAAYPACLSICQFTCKL